MNSTSTTSTAASGMAVDGGNLAKSYNLNVNVNVSAANSLVNNLLAVESACTTPRTPEILNSLIAMTNPLDDYSNYNASERCATGGLRGGSGNDSTSNSSGSPLGSPANGSTPSIQKTCSELIKAGLKLSIESKRKSSGSESLDGIPCTKKLKKEEPYCSDDDDYDDSYMSRCDGLTPEDEERRRRRRERNKIAATKCRLKKRERTVNLVTESEVLETQNIDLKSQIHELEAERRQLAEMLTLHTPSCIKNNPNQTSSPTTPYNPIQPPYDSPTGYPVSATPFEPNSPYIRPESANVLASSYTCDLENPPSNYNQPVDSLDIVPYSVQQPDGYMRQAETPSFVNGEAYPKNNGLMLVESPDNEYADTMQFENQDMNGYQYNNHQNSSQQCAHVNNGGARQKFRNPTMDNGCMA